MEEDIISSGTIRFSGYQGEAAESPYLCLKSQASAEMVWNHLTGSRQTCSTGWLLPHPKLIISITGGAKNYTMLPHVAMVLKQGLVSAAVTTGAWIITGGTATGVMKLVGEAVQEHALASGKLHDNSIVVLGIASLGYIAKHQALIKARRKPTQPVHYSWARAMAVGKGAPLDHHHTHFLLVDDGSRGVAGGEIEFRSRLEEYISKQIVSSDVHIPCVLVVVEGGVNTLRTVWESVKRDTPVVVIANSGRTADLITQAFDLTTPGNEGSVFTADFDEVMTSRCQAVLQVTEEVAQKATAMLRDCLNKRSLVNIFNLNSADSVKDIEREILYSALKVNNSDFASQLHLALALNCCDIAREEIFTYDYLKNREEQDNEVVNAAMFTALIQDQDDFVQLFLDYGVDLGQFLTVRVLRDLYSNSMTSDSNAELLKYAFSGAPSGRWFRRQGMPDFKTDPFLLPYISKVVVHLLTYNCSFYPDSYSVADDFKDQMEEDALDQDSLEFYYPKQELFLWAILFNRQKLAELFWKGNQDPIGEALLASALLKRLSVRAEKKEIVELAECLQQESAEWEQRAVNVLSECYSGDPAMTHSLLVREFSPAECHPWTGRPTLLNMAQAYQLMDFAGHTACQTKLSDVWKGCLALYTSHLKILLCLFLPFLLFTMKFRSADQQERSVGRQSNLKTIRLCRSKPNSISLLTAASWFYSAPVTKFLFNMVSYLTYLALLSYFLVVELGEGPPTPVEYLTWIWLFTMILEEIRQMLFSDQLTLSYRLWIWVNNAWNQIDLAMYTLSLLSICLRFSLSSDYFQWTRAAYGVTLVIFFIRFLHFFFAVKSMGPKVIMIQKMMADLFLFLAILLVFLIGFGVAYHANMFPKAPADWNILLNVLYFPYFQIFGELFLENMRGEEIEGCTRNESLWRQAGSSYKRCPEENDVLTPLLAVYMILTNILLVNLLIAMFSYTFTIVQENSRKLWRYYRLSLVHEYFDRPVLIPPCIIFCHLYNGLRYCCRCPADRYNAFNLKLDDTENMRLSAFERKCLEKYLLQQTQLDLPTVDVQMVADIKKRTDTMKDDLEKMKDTLQQLTTLLSSQAVSRKELTSSDQKSLPRL